MSENLQVINIEINDVTYNYVISKKRGIKNIRLKLNRDGILRVSMPWYVPKREATKILFENEKWIEKNFNILNLNKDKYYYLGNEIKIVQKVVSDIRRINSFLIDNIFYIESTGETLVDETQIFHEWLRKQANFYILPKVEEIAKKFGFKYNKVTIKDMRSRWGSCSSKKNLSFNLKLTYFKSEVIEYVIVHELCHLKEMNHSKKFWMLVESIIPNYKMYRKELKKTIL
ncbi:MAG: M48 family metallopeptidase [Ignavibacteriae bacterium]|nr:M48 family metallopeptidase [Ignavibacteriota bacterium]